MKYAIIKVVNGHYSVHAEGMTDLATAKTNYHGVCQTLWNAPDVITGTVAIVDESLRPLMGYCESIAHPQTETTEE